MIHTARVTGVQWSARTATVDDVPGPVPILRHIQSGQLQAGDTALVAHEGGQWWLLGVLGSSPPPPPPDDPGIPAPAPPPTPQEPVSLRPEWSGSWRNGWRSDTSDLFQGDWTGRGINTGGCWWGPLPPGIVSGELSLKRSEGSGYGAAASPTMALLAGTSRPAGAPVIRATAPGPSLVRGGTAQWALPESWITQLNAGTAGGIGVTSGGSSTPYLSLVASGVWMTLSLTTET